MAFTALGVFVLLPPMILHAVQCSVVIDNLHQKGVYVSEYCPKMPYCPEGAHVMCMFYNADRPMGPRCHKPKNVTITPVLANKLLEVSNAIRSKIALGKEKGKGGDLLPRGYGMFRLQWDSELATFAQVLANQCVLRHDMCRASKKFPNPGQTAGLVRFTYPDWFPVSNAGHFTKPGLTTAKLSYALTQSLKSWYGQKNYVAANMITSVPNWADAATNPIGRLYLEMIYGPATHMGCGISAYTEYAYYDNNANLNYNSVQVICNYSSRPRPGQPVYDVHPPTEVGFTVKCGCPAGADEDADCLCYESSRADESSVKPPFCSQSQRNCNPAVVLLPIFTVENAPPDKLISRNGPELLNEKETEIDIFDLYGSVNTSVLHPTQNFADLMNIHGMFDDVIKDATPINVPRNQTTRKTVLRDVRNRFFDVKNKTKNLYQHKPKSTKKTSIFSKVPTFYLSQNSVNLVKLDVKPRRDFSNAKNIVEQYMKQKKSHVNGKSDLSHFKTSNKHTRTETYLHSAEEKVMNNYYLSTGRSNFTQTRKSPTTLKFRTSSEKSNKDKLMHLLDRLEQEVKHIEFDGNKKEIFDAKIRKIYGTVVGKPVDLPATEFHSDFNISKNEKYSRPYGKDSELKNKEHFSKKDYELTDIEDYESDISSNSRRLGNKHELKLIEREQYSLSLLDRPREHHKYYNDETGKPNNLFPKNKVNQRRPNRRLKNNEDVLSPDRRKYYQEKLANLERRLKNTRHNHSRERPGLHLRPLLPPTNQEEPLRPTKKQIDPLYLPDRARFLHGF